MARHLAIVSLTAFAAIARAQDTGLPDNPGFFTLVEDLDPAIDGDYCWDVIGGTASTGKRVQAHSCHDFVMPANDQQFTSDYPDLGNIYVTQADLCLQARRVRAGADLFVTACSSSSAQSWVSSADGQIHPADDTSLCITIERGAPDGVSLYNRGLLLQACADFASRLTEWSIPGGSVGL
jgi:hypothetical protein